MEREASQMSVVPLMSALMPVPEPPPVTWMVVDGFFFMYSSAQRCPSTTIVSEPLTAIVPAVAADDQNVGASDSVVAAAAVMSMVVIFMGQCPFDSCVGRSRSLERDGQPEQELLLVLQLGRVDVVPAEGVEDV